MIIWQHFSNVPFSIETVFIEQTFKRSVGVTAAFQLHVRKNTGPLVEISDKKRRAGC